MDSLVSNQYDVRTNFLLGNPNLVYKIMINMHVDYDERDELYYEIIAQSLERPCNYAPEKGKITTYSWKFVYFQIKRYLQEKEKNRAVFLGDQDIRIPCRSTEYECSVRVQRLIECVRRVATEKEYIAAYYYAEMSSLKEVGEIMGITGERVNQLLKNIGKKVSKEGLLQAD